MGCSQSKSSAVVEPPPSAKVDAKASAKEVSQQEEQSRLLPAVIATTTTPPAVKALTKDEGPNNNIETASIDAAGNAASCSTQNEDQATDTNDASTTTVMMIPVVASADDTSEIQNVLQVEVKDTTTAFLDAGKEENGVSSNDVTADANDKGDGKAVGVDAPTSTVPTVPVELAVGVTIPAQGSTDSAVLAAAAAAAAMEETGSTTETLKENSVEETPQETEVAEASMPSEPETTPNTMEKKVNLHQPVVNEETTAPMAEMPVQLQSDPEAITAGDDMKMGAQPVAKEDETGSSSLPEAIKSVEMHDELPVGTDDVEVLNEGGVDSKQNENSGSLVVTDIASERKEEVGQPHLEVQAASHAAITATIEASPTDTLEAIRTSPVDDTLGHVVSSIVSEDENAKSKPECEKLITVEEAKSELVIAEPAEIKEEGNLLIAETIVTVAPKVVDENKDHDEALQLHVDQETSTVDEVENKGGPPLEKEELTEPIVGQNSDLAEMTETEEPRLSRRGAETSGGDTDDKPELIPSECSSAKEEVLTPVEHALTATNATETASIIGQFEASNMQAVDSSEPCVAVGKDEVSSGQPEQTTATSTQTTCKNIKSEEPVLTRGLGEAPVEKFSHLAESDHKLMGSEIEHPDTEASGSSDECLKGSTALHTKAAGGSDELKASAIEEQAASQPTTMEGTSDDQTSIGPKGPDAPDTVQIMADETLINEDIKKPGVAEDLDYSESHEASSSSADEEPTETSPGEEEEEEEPEDDEPILELKNVTAMTRVLIPEDQRNQSTPIAASRWGWPTGLGLSSGTNMTGIGNESVVSKSPEKASDEKDGTASKPLWGMQTGFLGSTKSTSEAEENEKAKSDLIQDNEVLQPVEVKVEPSSDVKEHESSTAAAGRSAAVATSRPTEQTTKNADPPKKKKLTDIEEARLFAASVLLESEHVVVKEEKAVPKRFGSWF